jgi:hypothetical protein
VNDIAEKAASNAWFTIIGRSAMLATMGLASWLLQAVGSLQTEVKVLANTVSFTMSDRYRGDDAKRDFQLRDLKIDALSERLQNIEHDVRSTRIDVKEQKIQQEQIEKSVPRKPR